MVVNPGTARAKRLGNIDTVVLQPGDVLEIRSAGGGGRGDPFLREPWRVAADVRGGYVSPEAAERDYGVVLRDGELDEAATAQLRANHSAPSAHFHFGPEREGYERNGPTPPMIACMRSSMPCRSIGASSRRPRFSAA